MNIIDNSSKKSGSFHLKSLILGAGKEDDKTNSDLRIYVLATTFLLWGIMVILGVGIFYFNSDVTNIWDSIVNTLMFGSMVGGAIFLVALPARNDWNRDYGLGIVTRIGLYNVLLFVVTVAISSGFGSKEYREPVKEFQFYTTDVKGCENKITMKSENMVYQYCSDYDSTYNSMIKSKDISATLIGTMKYGSNEADHVEFMQREVVKK